MFNINTNRINKVDTFIMAGVALTATTAVFATSSVMVGLIVVMIFVAAKWYFVQKYRA